MRRRQPRWDYHFWQGRPGLWKALLTAPVAEQVARAHPAYFTDLGYRCDPDPLLSPLQADANWVRLLGTGVAETLQRTGREQQERRELQQAHAAACIELAHYRELGPIPLRLAWLIRNLSHRFPRVAAAVKAAGGRLLRGRDAARTQETRVTPGASTDTPGREPAVVLRDTAVPGRTERRDDPGRPAVTPERCYRAPRASVPRCHLRLNGVPRPVEGQA
jgi:hypothetical protein